MLQRANARRPIIPKKPHEIYVAVLPPHISPRQCHPHDFQWLKVKNHNTVGEVKIAHVVRTSTKVILMCGVDNPEESKRIAELPQIRGVVALWTIVDTTKPVSLQHIRSKHLDARTSGQSLDYTKSTFCPPPASRAVSLPEKNVTRAYPKSMMGDRHLSSENELKAVSHLGKRSAEAACFSVDDGAPATKLNAPRWSREAARSVRSGNVDNDEASIDANPTLGDLSGQRSTAAASGSQGSTMPLGSAKSIEFGKSWNPLSLKLLSPSKLGLIAAGSISSQSDDASNPMHGEKSNLNFPTIATDRGSDSHETKKRSITSPYSSQNPLSKLQQKVQLSKGRWRNDIFDDVLQDFKEEYPQANLIAVKDGSGKRGPLIYCRECGFATKSDTFATGLSVVDFERNMNALEIHLRSERHMSKFKQSEMKTR